MFNKETEYALRGLVYVQTQNLNGHRPGIAEIARQIGAPPFYTAKILHHMVKAGFVASIKGKGGGFYFEKEKPDLKLRELIGSIEGKKLFYGCGLGLKHCTNANPCPIHEQYMPIRNAINEMISTETIQSLASRSANLGQDRS